MDDDGKASGESRQDHPTTAASAPAQEGKIEPFASTFAGATIDVAAGPAGTATRKPRTSSATSVQPTSPPCRNDSTGSKKTGSRHSSGNSRKNSSTLNSGRNGSSLTVDPHSAALVVCTGSQGSSRLNNRRFSSSNSGSLIGTITARKCVGCAAGRDSIVCSATSQRKRSKDDARNDPNVHSSLMHPSIFTGTTLYSSAVASSSACGSVPTFSPRLQQECLRKREDEQEEKQSRSEEGQQAQPKHLPQNTPREELHHPQHGKNGMQQLPSPGFMQILYTQTVNEEGQHITGSVLQSEISLAPQFDAVHSNVNPPRPPEQRSPTPVLLNPPQPCVERNSQTHHKYLREQQRFKNLQHNQTVNLLKQTTHLQGHPAEPVQHSEPQGMQRNLHLRGQNQQSEQVKQATEQGPLLELNAVSFADRKATQSEMAGTAGGSSGTGRLPDTTALYAATAAGRRDGLIVSFPNPQENRLGLIPSVYGGEISAVSRTPVQQQLQRQLGMEMKNSAVLGPSVQAVGPLGSGPGPSPSVAAMATTPRIRLAAASQRHQPPPCTTVLPALPRCSVSASGAYPEMPPVPVLNSEFDATAAATGEVRLSPTAAAILRGAASAAAAAAAAATDAASLVKCGNWAPELTGSSASVANTGVCGAGQSAPVAAAATLTSTALHAFLADSPGGQKSDQSTGFIVGNSTSVHQAARESTRPQQMAPHQPQHPQHFDSCDSQGTLRTSTVVSAEGAEHPSALTSTSRSVSVDGTGGRTLLNSGDSSVSSEARMEKLQHLTATAAFHTPCFEDATGAACGRAATAGIDLIASSLPRRRAPMAVVADTLAATSPATLKIHALGPVKPEKFPAKFLQAFPHSGSPPILRVGNATQGETAVALGDASESACRMEPPTDACGVASSVLTCNKEVKEDLYQKLFADNGAPASDTPAAPREAEIVTVAAEKKEVSPTNLGNTTAKDSNKCAAITSESVTPVTGARPGSVTGLNCLSQKFGMANSALRPLQLPESPRYGSYTTGGENTAVGTPGGDTKLTKCLSPDTTPGTPQNCQLQQLLMHRTPAPQDRPRRPAAASAAGLLVRRGGPVTMWGFGAAMDAAVSSAAVASVTQSVTDAAAVTSSLDADGDVTACGSAVAVADDDGTESAVVCEKPEGDGNLQPDQEDPTQKATNSEKTLRCEKNNQSVVLPGPEESDSDRSFNSNPTATLAPSAAEQLQTGSTLRTAEKMSFETDDRGDVKLVEMHQEKLHTVHDGGEAGQPPSPQQQHQQDTQHPLKLDEKPSIQEGEAEPLPQSLHNSEAQQKDLYNSYAAVQQQIPVEFSQQRGCQSRWGKQEMLRCTQIGAKEETALQGEHSLPLHVKEGSEKELCSAKSLAPVPSDLEKTTCLSPSVTNRIAAGAVDVTPVSSFIPAVVEAERQRDVQVENSDTYHSEELVYFSGSNKSSNSGSSSIRKRNSKKLVKQHSSGSDRTRSSLRCSNDSINEQSGLCSSRGGSRSGDYTQKNRGNETCNSSDSELTYFPFLKDQEFLTESQVGGDSEAMTPPAAGGMTSMTYIGDSATWQMHTHTTNAAEDALRRANCHYRTSTETGVAEQLPFPQELGQQQQASESPAAAFEWESSEFQQRYGSVEQRGFSKHESDMDDNLPLSAAAMAAALAAGSSDISDSSVAPRAACHERSPEQQFTPTSQKHLPCSDLREGVHYRMSTPVAEHLDTPWATPTSGRGPAYNLHTSRNNEQTTGEFVPPKFYPQHGRQQQVLSAPQQQVLTGQAHMSRPSSPLPAAERPLFQDECSAFPGASALPAHLQPLQQQNRHLLQEPDEQISPPLLQATIGDKAAPFVVETGRSSSTYNTQQEAVLMGPSRECVTPQQQHLQQSLRQQQHLQSVHQQLMLHQQQQQQVTRTRQPLYSLSRSRLPDSCDAQMLQRLGAAHASGLIVSNHWNRNSLPTRPCLWPQESYTYENLPCSAISSSHRCTSSNTAQPSSPRLKRAGPGAAAVTLAAVTGSAPIGINTAIEDTATSGPAGDAADLTSLPDEQQEGRQEAFCPFRRTVETRRARSNPLGTSHSIAASAGSTSEEEISADEAGGVRGQSLSNNRHTSGTLRKRFLGGTKRLFGGVKMHAAAANTRDKLPLNNCESALPPPGGPFAPQHAPRPSFSSTWQSLTQARTPIGDPLFGSQSPVRYLHQQPTTGAHNLQQLQGTLKGTHPQFAEEEGNQQPLAPLSQQQRLLSQQQPVSSQQQRLLSQQQSLLTPQQPLLTQKQSLSSLPQQFGAHSRNHSPRTAQVLPYHALSDSTFAYPTCMAQRYPQLSMLEQQHQFLGNHPSVSLLQRMPSRYSHRSARSALPRRGKSCSNTFLCETIRGSNRALNIASLRRESQPACGRSRNCSLPRLPCVAGRLLLAGGRAVGEVGQAAVDVGSTVVKELANVLQRSVRNILDLEEDHPCVEKVEYDGEERQCIRSNSLCIPVTGVRARRFSQQKGFTYGSDPALGAGQTWQVTGCPTEEQLQHKLWMQEQVSRELQQQCGPHVEEYQHRGGSWRLPQQTHSQRSEWRSSRSLPPFFEDARERRSLEHSVRTEGPSPQTWDISKGESLGGLWLPRIHCQPGSPNQLELHSGAEANTAPQQVEVRPLEQEALDQQQLQWPGENQHGFENEGQFMRFHKLKQHEQVVGARLRKHAEFYDFANRHPENEQVLEEETSTAGSLAFRQGNLYQTLPHNWKCLERPQLRQLQEHSQDWTLVGGRTVKKDVPEFPNFLQWDENTPHSSMPESWAYSKQYALTGASEVRDYVEQEEARERLVRLAASATAVQSSNLATDQLTEDKAVPTGQSLACAPVCWADCGSVDHQGRSQLSDSCTISVNRMAFQQLDGNDTRSSNHNSAVALPSCDAKVGDSNADHLFWTGDPDSPTEFREPRKGTSTFGRPELMSQYDGKQSALCLSDDGSNCSTRNSCKEDDRALRDVSVETLSPRFHSSKENSQKGTPPLAIATHENLADGIALQQQAEAYTPRRQHQQSDDPHETATTRKEFDASSRLYGRAQQESYLSLHVQGIASSKQPVTRLSQPVHLSLGRTLHKRPENLPCKPYGAWVQDAVDTNAKLEARDRIVQRWKERTTRNLAESLAAGIRRR